MASGKLNNEIDNAAGNITAGNTAGGNITGGSVSDGGIAAGNIADKTICQEISLTFQTEMQWLLTIRTG